MWTLSTPVRLTAIAAHHPAAHRYLLARRCALSRDEPVIAVAGLWAHRQLLALNACVEAFLWCPDAGSDAGDPGLARVVAGVVEAAQMSYQISARTLARLHPGAEAPGLLSLVRIPTWPMERVLVGARRVLVADGIEYAGNLGALVRTVDASGADALVLTSPVARLTHPTVFSASRGTVLTTPVLELAAAAPARAALEAAGFRIVVAHPEAGRDYRWIRYDDPRVAIVVGSEGSGVSAAWRAGPVDRVSISMRGRADSLNVAVAAAVLLFASIPPDDRAARR